MNVFKEVWKLVGYSNEITQYLEENKHLLEMMDTYLELEELIKRFQFQVDRTLSKFAPEDGFHYEMFHDEFEVYDQRILEALLKNLKSVILDIQKTYNLDPLYKSNFDIKTDTLSILRKHDVQFKGGRLPSKMIAELFSNPEKRHSIGDITDRIGLKDDRKARKGYFACRNLNRTIRAKAGVKDFLIITDQDHVSINPRYLGPISL